ncbi:MAG: PTS sugar transporter subunit IIA [Kiritimatiellae bacterium]|nr:PTS sugar transporter subunit IIA [Kiritimatiellia bacterium]
MRLSEVINVDRVLIDFDAKTKEDAIGRLVAAVINGFDRETVLSALLEREKLGSTGVGHGVAVPHVRLEAVETPVVVFGRSAAPVEFDAIDEEPCRLFFLVLGPTRQEAQEAYLQTMAKISRLMRDSAVREALVSAETGAQVIRTLAEKEA